MPTDRILPALDDTDGEQIARIRRELAGWRVTCGMRQKDITAKAGLSDVVVSAFERGEPGPIRLANICKYASVFGLAVHVALEGFDVLPSTPELESLNVLVDADPFNALWLETLVVKYLRTIRKDLGIPLHVMAQKLGMRSDSLSAWEIDGSDPHLYRMMAYATQLGGRLTLRLVLVP
jgi:Predicted transcriptional regulators